MEKLGAIQKRIAAKPSAVAGLTLVTALLPWIITFAPPILRSLQVGFATDACRFIVGWLTTPVLFILVNFVILSIWATSSGSSNNRSESELAPLDPLGAASKRKETLVYLPPIVSPVKPELHGSVFSRSAPDSVTAKVSDSVPDSADTNEEMVKVPAPTPESGDVDEGGGGSDSSKPRVELKIPPPPPPSFLAGHDGFKLRTRKVERRNSAPITSKKASRTTRSLSDSHKAGVVLKDMKLGDGNQDSDELSQRFESAIANFYAQLRLQSKEIHS